VSGGGLVGLFCACTAIPPPSPPLPVAMEMTKIVCIYNGRIYSEGCKNLTEIKRKLKENLPLSILIAISQMDFVKV